MASFPVSQLYSKESPSIYYNNLTSSGFFLAYLHKNDPCFFSELNLNGKNKSVARRVKPKSGGNATGLKWCKMEQRPFLVRTGYSGVNV